jgi:hypothetical protein
LFPAFCYFFISFQKIQKLDGHKSENLEAPSHELLSFSLLGPSSFWISRKLIHKSDEKLKQTPPKLSPIVTMNGFQEVGMLIVQPQSQALQVLKHFILTLQEENPRVMRIVINDDMNVSLDSHGANPRGTNIFHMK